MEGVRVGLPVVHGTLVHHEEDGGVGADGGLRAGQEAVGGAVRRRKESRAGVVGVAVVGDHLVQLKRLAVEQVLVSRQPGVETHPAGGQSCWGKGVGVGVGL